MTNETLEHKTIQSIIPVVDIVETSAAYVVALDIPGAVKEKIQARIENNTLIISADVSADVQSEYAECAKRYFRDFSLANDIDIQTVDAQFELGVLRITLNKKKQFLPKHLVIN